MSHYNAAAAAALCADNPQADYYYYIQYLLHCQLLAARHEAT